MPGCLFDRTTRARNSARENPLRLRRTTGRRYTVQDQEYAIKRRNVLRFWVVIAFEAYLVA